MERPREDTSPDDLLGHSAFTVAGVAADPAVSGQEQGLKAAHDALKKGVRAREDSSEEKLQRRAVLVVRDRFCDAPVKEFEVRLYALVNKNRSDALYRRYFPNGLRDITEAEMRKTEPEMVDQMITAMKEDAAKPDIGPLATEMAPKVQTAVDDVRLAEKALTSVETDLAYMHDKTIPALRATWEDEYVKLYGAMKIAFPRDAHRVETFFLPFRKDKKKVDASAGQGAPQTPPGNGATPPAATPPTGTP
jgi:hypothetical protein